jgi:hypothetical protein
MRPLGDGAVFVWLSARAALLVAEGHRADQSLQ